MKKKILFGFGEGAWKKSRMSQNPILTLTPVKYNTYPSRNTHDTGNHFLVILIK